ncbi:glycosyltransferase [Pseudalkalibacillus hwajinpoensis]|uniref:glycosyltransferase n=1 Tax=Guptibacillus hwajinpoensis TaxID=208199 RepID=UPI001CFF0C6B|nr:glycosyltransferase [Pseudalkalibacillus hwajinpoensis]
MKKKLLFVIDSLAIGGAEKSLVSLLSNINSSIFEVDLMVFKSGGELESYVPNYVNILPQLEYFSFLNGGSVMLWKKILFSYYRWKASINLRLNNFRRNALHSEQVIYKSTGKILLTDLKKKYDVAIAYSQGLPTYIVANKIIAEKKLAWINTDYSNTLYNKDIDYLSYKKIDKIIAVSQNTKNSILKIRREYINKVEVVMDILDPDIIYSMANEEPIEEFSNVNIKILSVGRLESVKSYDRAIKVAEMLKKSNCNFKWYVIGEGSERRKLQEMIDNFGLTDCFILMGKKINPYKYMNCCDIYVQTSLKEGFGLTVSEAKILKKPIVCTNFPTAKEIITHKVDGLIVEQNIENIYEGIMKLINDSELNKSIINQLNNTIPYNSKSEIEKIYQIINKEM